VHNNIILSKYTIFSAREQNLSTWPPHDRTWNCVDCSQLVGDMSS